MDTSISQVKHCRNSKKRKSTIIKFICLTKKDYIMNSFPIFKIEEFKSKIFNIDTHSITTTKYFPMFNDLYDELSQFKTELSIYINKNPYQINCKTVYYLFYTIVSNLLAKIYLLTIGGFILCQEKPNLIDKVLKDLITLLELLNDPIPSFFARYFVFKILQDLIKQCPIEKSEHYIYDNIIKMNYLINKTGNPLDMQLLHVLIVENLNLLINLPGIDINYFKSRNLNNILSLVSIEGQKIKSEYILNWIILGFNEENICICLSAILNKFSELAKIDSNIPKNTNNLIERILNFHYSCGKEIKKRNINNISNDIDNINKYITIILKYGKDIKSTPMKIFLQYIISFIKLNIIAIPSLVKHEHYDNIFGIIERFIKSSRSLTAINPNIKIKEFGKEKTFEVDNIPLFDKIITLLTENNVNLSKCLKLFRILKYFDQQNKKIICYRILVYILKSRYLIENEIQLNNVISCLDNIINIKSDIKHFLQKEDEIISKERLISITLIKIYNNNIDNFIRLLMMFKNIFFKKQIIDELKNSFEHYLLALLSLAQSCEKCFICFQCSQPYPITKPCTPISLLEVDVINEIMKVKYIDISNYKETELWTSLKYLYTNICGEIKNNFMTFQFACLEFLLIGIKCIDKVQFNPSYYEEISFAFLSLFNHVIFNIPDNKMKVDYLSKIIQLLPQLNLLSKEKYECIADRIVRSIKVIQKRADTAKLMIQACDMFYSKNLINLKKVGDYLKEAEKNGNITLLKPENLEIFDRILEKFLFFYQKGETFITKEDIERIIKIITLHLEDINDENVKKYIVKGLIQKNYQFSNLMKKLNLLPIKVE